MILFLGLVFLFFEIKKNDDMFDYVVSKKMFQNISFLEEEKGMFLKKKKRCFLEKKMLFILFLFQKYIYVKKKTDF